MNLWSSAIVLLFIACNFVSCKINEVFITNLWKEFKANHGKEYLSDEIEAARFAIFKENMAKIEKHNYEHAVGIHTFTLGVNHFADWTTEEFSSMLGFRSNYTQKNLAKSTHTFLRLPAEVKLPESIDWREKGVVTDVKDQGQCGSCWSFSATGALEAAHARATGQLVSLSEQQLLDCSGKYGNSGCDGGLMDNAFKYVQENQGLDTEESYAYHARQSKCHYKPQNVGATCTGYVDVTSSEDALKEAVATIGPISIAIDATQDKFMLYKSGVFVDPTCGNQPDNLDHGVLVVGYGTENNIDFWIVKNSWGHRWGENGYIRMARNKDNMCGIATSASYPLVK